MIEAHYHRRNLPHIYIPERSYFITFRLKGSLLMRKLYELRNILEAKHKAQSKAEVYEVNKKFFAEYDKSLDTANKGPKFLYVDKITDIIIGSFKYYDRKDYSLVCVCIMPNHVHVLFTLLEKSRSLDKIMQSVKRYSALQINRQLNRSGTVWQPESYDHVIRDEDEYFNIIRYILDNPIKAGLIDNWFEWKGTFISDYLKEMLE
ncbi:MAG: transposase [Ignavibacteriales bacterium]|nr:transposase [Ignavibacteriales bacterium]